MDGTMAMHFAPDMMLSGMPRSGASMIWLRMVVALCTRSTSALRAADWAHMAVETRTSRATEIFFITRLQSESRCIRPVDTGCRHLIGFCRGFSRIEARWLVTL